MTTRALRKNISRKLIVIMGLICMITIISGCAEIQKTFNEVLSGLRGDASDRQTGPRDETIRRYNYQGVKDQIIVESPKVSPNVASPGNEITQEVQFALLAPQPEKTFKVLEVVTLSGRDILIELSRKDSDKAQGLHTSTVKFVIPQDLPRGDYRLVTTINANGLEMKQTGSFAVR